MSSNSILKGQPRPNRIFVLFCPCWHNTPPAVLSTCQCLLALCPLIALPSGDSEQPGGDYTSLRYQLMAHQRLLPVSIHSQQNGRLLSWVFTYATFEPSSGKFVGTGANASTAGKLSPSWLQRWLLLQILYIRIRNQEEPPFHCMVRYLIVYGVQDHGYQVRCAMRSKHEKTVYKVISVTNPINNPEQTPDSSSSFISNTHIQYCHINDYYYT